MTLSRNNKGYRARVFITNLRAGSNYYAIPTASVLEIAIYNVRNNVAPQLPEQVRPPMMGQMGGIGGPMGAPMQGQ